jgi:hypothetical protein
VTEPKTPGRGPCGFAVLRAELAVSCADRAQSGEVSFVDDTKLIWRLDGREMMFVAPADCAGAPRPPP